MNNSEKFALKRLLNLIRIDKDETDYWWNEIPYEKLRLPLYTFCQPAFYGSLDAANALMKELLPEYQLSAV
jgi:hypothetical protein